MILLSSQEDSNFTLLRTLLMSCKHVHLKHVYGLGFMVKPAGKAEPRGHRQSVC